jgi:hypothetical protein
MISVWLTYGVREVTSLLKIGGDYLAARIEGHRLHSTGRSAYKEKVRRDVVYVRTHTKRGRL